MKRCTKCETDKPLDAFSKNASRKDGLNGHCKVCISTAKKVNYAANRVARVAKVIARRNAIRDKLWAYKQGLACVDCGLIDPVVLEFDHLGDKEFNVSKMVVDGYSWDRILKEIQKCEPVCANHHRHRTHARGGWKRNITVDVPAISAHVV